MILKPNNVALVFCLVIMGMPVLAQTSNDLERKYGRQDNHFVRRIGYKVRPGIIMTVSFTKDNQVCEAVIEPQRASESGIDYERRMSTMAAEEIVNEIVPVEQRGKRTGGMIFGNYTSWARDEYERAWIMRLLVGVGGPEKDMQVGEVRIRWKQRQCH
jgi:hypothetical protein